MSKSSAVEKNPASGRILSPLEVLEIENDNYNEGNKKRTTSFTRLPRDHKKKIGLGKQKVTSSSKKNIREQKGTSSSKDEINEEDTNPSQDSDLNQQMDEGGMEDLDESDDHDESHDNVQRGSLDYCSICKCKVPKGGMKMHNTGIRHKQNINNQRDSSNRKHPMHHSNESRDRSAGNRQSRNKRQKDELHANNKEIYDYIWSHLNQFKMSYITELDILTFYCRICDAEIARANDGEKLHMTSVEHCAQDKTSNHPWKTKFKELADLLNYHCPICNKTLSVKQWFRHFFSKEHIQACMDKGEELVSEYANVPGPHWPEIQREMLRSIKEKADIRSTVTTSEAILISTPKGFGLDHEILTIIRERELYCEICDTVLPLHKVKTHLKEPLHKTRIHIRRDPITNMMFVAGKKYGWNCEICTSVLQQSHWMKHLGGKTHIMTCFEKRSVLEKTFAGLPGPHWPQLKALMTVQYEEFMKQKELEETNACSSASKTDECHQAASENDGTTVDDSTSLPTSSHMKEETEHPTSEMEYHGEPPACQEQRLTTQTDSRLTGRKTDEFPLEHHSQEKNDTKMSQATIKNMLPLATLFNAVVNMNKYQQTTRNEQLSPDGDVSSYTDIQKNRGSLTQNVGVDRSLTSNPIVRGREDRGDPDKYSDEVGYYSDFPLENKHEDKSDFFHTQQIVGHSSEICDQADGADRHANTRQHMSRERSPRDEVIHVHDGELYENYELYKDERLHNDGNYCEKRDRYKMNRDTDIRVDQDYSTRNRSKIHGDDRDRNSRDNWTTRKGTDTRVEMERDKYARKDMRDRDHNIVRGRHSRDDCDEDVKSGEDFGNGAGHRTERRSQHRERDSVFEEPRHSWKEMDQSDRKHQKKQGFDEYHSRREHFYDRQQDRPTDNERYRVEGRDAVRDRHRERSRDRDWERRGYREDTERREMAGRERHRSSHNPENSHEKRHASREDRKESWRSKQDDKNAAVHDAIVSFVEALKLFLLTIQGQSAWMISEEEQALDILTIEEHTQAYQISDKMRLPNCLPAFNAVLGLRVLDHRVMDTLGGVSNRQLDEVVCNFPELVHDPIHDRVLTVLREVGIQDGIMGFLGI